MDIGFLERYYERVILPQYNCSEFRKIVWIDHGGIGEHYDAFAHYFKDATGSEYVLIFEDYPSGDIPFADRISHKVVYVGDRATLYFGGEPPFKYMVNVTGYFTLYKEEVGK